MIRGIHEPFKEKKILESCCRCFNFYFNSGVFTYFVHFNGDRILMKDIIKILSDIKSDTVNNYVIAGLNSSLLNNGEIRYFENSRNHQDSITPHSHRFDFVCLVLCGGVTNHIWNDCLENEGDFFEESNLFYNGSIGDHKKTRTGRDFYRKISTEYRPGETYSMTHDEIHSINFSRGAKVLFFEGPEKVNVSRIIEPVVNGIVIPTYQKLDYMFLKDDNGQADKNN